MERYRLRTMLWHGLTLPYRQSVVRNAVCTREIGRWRSLLYMLPQMLLSLVLMMASMDPHLVATEGGGPDLLLASITAAIVLVYGGYVASPWLFRLFFPWAKVISGEVRRAYVAQCVMMVEWLILAVSAALVLGLMVFLGVPTEVYVILATVVVVPMLYLAGGGILIVFADLIEVRRPIFVLMTLVGPGILFALAIALRAAVDRLV